MSETCVIIPARFDSSRFPGKPLVEICGKPLVVWVADAAAKAVTDEHVYVATDSEKIALVVKAWGYKFIMTPSACKALPYKNFINVQGDEPLVSPRDIEKLGKIKRESPEHIINGMCELSDGEDVQSKNIPKVVTNEAGLLLYMSRAAIPGTKAKAKHKLKYKKQVCIYAFSREDLVRYLDFGRKSDLELHEDIEILRFFELGRQILMIETSPGSLAVDTPEDIIAVENAMNELGYV